MSCANIKWRVAKSLQMLRAQVDAAAPNRVKSHDGTIGDAAHCSTSSDHNPNIIVNGVGVVTAFDLTDDPVGGCSADAVVTAVVNSRDSRIKYIIYKRKIISSVTQPWVWRKYSGSNPHISHAHFSVLPQSAKFDNTTTWNIGLLHSAPAVPVTGQVLQVIATRLNVRSGPGLDFQVIGFLDAGTKVTAIESRLDWVRIAEDQWAHATFLR